MDDEPSCSYCDRPAEATCRRCARDFCGLHGDDLCIACMDPSSGVPSGPLFRAVLGGFALCVIAGLWFLVASPRLPGEAAGSASRAQTSATPSGSTSGSSSAAAVTPAASATATNTRSYTVQPGDTLASIASAIGVSSGSIVQLNPTIDPDNLQIGQTLRLPVLQAP